MIKLMLTVLSCVLSTYRRRGQIGTRRHEGIRACPAICLSGVCRTHQGKGFKVKPKSTYRYNVLVFSCSGNFFF